MLKLITSLSRGHKTVIILMLDLLLLPLAMLFAFMVQSLPRSGLEVMADVLPVLPWLLGPVAGLALWLGLPKIQLKAYERRAVGLTAILAGGAGLWLVGLLRLIDPDLPIGTSVIFALCYFLSMVAARVILLQLVMKVYRRARPCR